MGWVSLTIMKYDVDNPSLMFGKGSNMAGAMNIMWKVIVLVSFERGYTDGNASKIGGVKGGRENYILMAGTNLSLIRFEM